MRLPEAVMEEGASAARAMDAQARSAGSRAVTRWLFCIWFLVLLMVMVGGITRLTGSGLSITRWQPVSGIVPPLSEAAWQVEYAHYKASPEFQQVNHWMGLPDFKRIFFWEYLHRLLGRLIGFAVLVPWVVFVVRKQLVGAMRWKTLGLIALGGLQGVLGWYMVKSGLVNEPRVSHYRLAAHLLLAFFVGQVVVWLALQTSGQARAAAATDRAHALVLRATYGMLALLWLQCLYGAFMAGTRAGYYFGTFPDMHGQIAPGAFFKARTWLENLLDYPPAIHWIHRALGFAVLGAALGLGALAARLPVERWVKTPALWIAGIAFVQLNLGAITVLTRVHVSWAVAHQAVAYVLLSAGTWLLFQCKRVKSEGMRL
jgi:cytochrome c oxidase assembly protein subunit 15